MRDCTKKDHRIEIRVSADEFKKIESNWKQSKMQSRSAFLRRMALRGCCFSIDLSELQKLKTLVSRCGNNMNQYARRANASGSIYLEDIREMQQELAEIRERLYELTEALMQVS